MRTLLAALVLLPAVGARAQDKVGTTSAVFLGIGVGARGTAMGGAQTAAAEGPSALYWNPAAITRTPGHAAEFSTMSWLVDSRFQSVGVVFDAGALGHVGLNLLALDYGEMEVRTIDNPEGTGERFTPLDLALGVSYAKALTDRFAVGGTARFVQQRIWNERANGAAVDLGVSYQTAFRGLRIGATLANFGTDMRLAGKDLQQAIDPDPNTNGNNPRLPGSLDVGEWAMPLTFRVGLQADAYRAGDHRLVATVDALAPSDNAQAASFGAEYGFRDLLYVRGGYRQAFASQADDQGWALGGGLRYRFAEGLTLTADYAFRNQDPFGTPQTLTVGVRF